MDVPARRVLWDLLREAEVLVSPLIRATRGHAELYRYFRDLGWDLRAVLGVDLAALRDHLETARRDLEGIRVAALGSGDDTAILQAIGQGFRHAVDRAEPLYDLVVAAAPLPVTDDVVAAFAEDVARDLVTRYVLRSAPALYHLGVLTGLIRKQRATPLYSSPPEPVLLRHPVERMLVDPGDLLQAIVNPAVSLVSEASSPEHLVAALRRRFEEASDRLQEATNGRGLQGLDVRVSTTGVSLSTGILSMGTDVPDVRIPVAGGLASLVVGPATCGVEWTIPALTTTGADLVLFDVAGLLVTAPGGEVPELPPTGVTVRHAHGRTHVDVVGTLAVELPLAVLAGEAGDAVRLSATVHLEYDEGEDPVLTLAEASVRGRFRIGGPAGLVVEDAELVVSDMPLPPPPPTTIRPFPADVRLHGRLVVPDHDLRIDVKASYEDGTWQVETTGSVRFPNGVELLAQPGRPVLQLTASPGPGRYHFEAAGIASFPTDDGAAELRGAGSLDLQTTGAGPDVEHFSFDASADGWSLGGAVDLRNLRLALGFDGTRFTAVVAATIECANGFRLDVLDRLPAGLPAGTAPGLTMAKANGVVTATIASGIRLTFPPDTLTADTGGLVTAEASGVLTLSSDPGVAPSLTSLSFAVAAHRVRLGGSDGLVVEDASFRGTNVERFLDLGTAPHPEIVVGGTIVCPVDATAEALRLTLRDACFTFDSRDAPPLFSFEDNGEMGFENAADTGLPVEVTKARLRLLSGERLPQALAPDNVELSIGVRLALDFGSTVGAVGEIDRVTVRLDRGVPRVTLEGASFEVENLGIPPLTFSGGLGIHNLVDPMNLQLEGMLGGNVQGAYVKALVALKVDQGRPQPLGVCFDVNLGPSGVSVLYGFTIQGMGGGMSFANTNRDPCDFTTYTRARQPIRLTKTRGRVPAERPRPSAGCDCNCPPPSMNILCQPHPDQDLHPGRAILKFTAIEEAMWRDLPVPRDDGSAVTMGAWLDEIDRTVRDAVAARTPGFDGRAVAIDVASRVTAAARDLVASIVPAVDPAAVEPRPPAEALAAFDAIRDVYLRPAEHWAAATATALAGELGAKLDALAAGEPVPALRTVVADLLYRGVSCPDVTMQVTGSFSYVGVSSFAYVVGGVTMSTAGSIGVTGTLMVFGVPFGVLRAFVTGTGPTGLPEPSMCGDLRFEIGPVRFGVMNLEYRIPGAVMNYVEPLAKFADRLSRPLLTRVLRRIAPEDAPVDGRAGFDWDQLASSMKLLTAPEAAQVMAMVLSEVPDNPTQARSVAAFARDLVAELWDGYDPQITLCGEVAPTVFGLPMARLAQARATITKERLTAEVSFSPLYLIGRFLPVADLFSGMDSARLEVGLTLPRLEQLAADGLLAHVAGQETFDQVLDGGLHRLLTESTFTFTYQFFPLGMRVANAQGRIVMPYVTIDTPHPAARASRWRNPDDDRGGRGLPSRRHVLFAALDRDRLADAEWFGAVREVMEDLPADQQNLELQRDYLPHGGVLGAGRLEIPRLLWDAPPFHLVGRCLATDDWRNRLEALVELVREWVLATRPAGTLAFYLPAPSPPAAVVNAADIAWRDLVDSITDDAGGFPTHLAFFEGQIEGRLLGCDIGKADVYFTPPPVAGGTSELRVRGSSSADPRLAAWVRGTAIELVVTVAPGDAVLEPVDRQTIEERFALLLARLETGLAATDPAWDGSAPAPSLVALAEAAVGAVARHLPKVALTAEVAVQTPPAVASWLELAAGASARLVAYSPFYDPSAVGDGPDAVARRHGGWCVEADVGIAFGNVLRCRARATCALQLAPGDRPARLVGRARLDAVDTFTFLGAPVGFGTAELVFDTEPPDGEPMARLVGSSDAIAFGPVRVEAITPGAALAIELQLHARPTGVDVALVVPPARLVVRGVDPATPIEIRPLEAGSSVVRGDGTGVTVSAPAGVRLVDDAGRCVVALEGPLTGTVTFGGGVPALALAGALEATILPDDPVFRRQVSLPATTSVRVDGSGSFAVEVQVPPIEMADGQLVLQGGANRRSPLRMIATEHGVHLVGEARLVAEFAGMKRSDGVVHELRVGASGDVFVSGRGMEVGVPGVLAVKPAAFRLGRAADGTFEVVFDDVQVRLLALDEAELRWRLVLAPGRLEATLLAPDGTFRFGDRFAVRAGNWRLAGGFDEVRLAASSVEVSLLGRPLATVAQAAFDLGGGELRGTVSLDSPPFPLVPGMTELAPSTVDVRWARGSGRVAVAGRLWALPRLDGTSGWAVDRPVELALESDTFRIGVAQQVPLLAVPGLTLRADAAVGRDAEGFGLWLGVDAVVLGAAMARRDARVGGDGRFLLRWGDTGRLTLGPVALKYAGSMVAGDLTARSVSVECGAARLVAGGGAPGWPAVAGEAPLPACRIAWVAGALAGSTDATVTIAGRAGEWRTYGPLRYRVKTAAVRVGLRLGAAPAGVAVGPFSLRGATVLAETAATHDGRPWASTDNWPIGDSTVLADGTVTFILPDLLDQARRACYRVAEDDNPLASPPNRNNFRYPGGDVAYNLAMNTYNALVAVRDSAKRACDTALRTPPGWSSPPVITAKVRELFPFA